MQVEYTLSTANESRVLLMRAMKINVILHTPSDTEQMMEKTNEFILNSIVKRIKISGVGEQMYEKLGKDSI
jgi:hypothetical protein|nr:hypothetical protein [uncultured Lachnoclostridium sp.]